MRFTQGKLILDDVTTWRTDGHSVTLTDPVGATIVVPLVVLKELLENVEEYLDEQGVSDR